MGPGQGVPVAGGMGPGQGVPVGMEGSVDVQLPDQAGCTPRDEPLGQLWQHLQGGRAGGAFSRGCRAGGEQAKTVGK